MGAATQRQSHVSIVKAFKGDHTHPVSSKNTVESDLHYKGIKHDHIRAVGMARIQIDMV